MNQGIMFWKNFCGINSPAFLDQYGAGVSGDYSIDLNKIEVVFPNKSDE